MKKRAIGFIILFVSLMSYSAKSQEIMIDLGVQSIAINEYFTITLTINNDRLKTYSSFPEIQGFVKRGTSSSASTNIVNGKMSFTQSVSQNYQALKEGKVTIPAFQILVNGMAVKSKGGTITVGPPKEVRKAYDPFEDFFGKKNEPKEFLDVKEDAFFALSTNKDEVYLGEGINATLAFYVAAENRAEMQFYDLGTQIVAILKKVRPANCWEENFGIEEIQKEPVVINNRSYTKYKLYQATFFPFNNKDVVFPSVPMKMIKYKVAKNPSFFGDNRQEDFKLFNTTKKAIKVKNLPPHPLKDQVSVGSFRLEDKVNKRSLNSGETFSYSFKIIGEGNISALTDPVVKESNALDFYDPQTQQNINRAGNKVTGSKAYTYYAIPNEPGTYNLSDYVNWIYFNTDKEKYDTLKSTIAIEVGGESRQNSNISSNDLGPFYDEIEITDNELRNRDNSEWLKIFANIFILAMVVFTAIIVFKK